MAMLQQLSATIAATVIILQACYGFHNQNNLYKFNIIRLYGKGFASTPRTKGSTSPQTKKDDRAVLEETIQRAIDSEDGLREAMNAFSRPDSSTSSSIGSWDKESVRKRLLEITWNKSASIRNNRHQSGNEKIPAHVDQHMNGLARWCLSTSNSTLTSSILHVGCGTGVLIKYIQSCSLYNAEKVSISGIDLASEMIEIAKRNYPTCQFHVGDFSSFQPSNTFTVVVFNECLHYFSDTQNILNRAKLLLTLSSDSKIIISHPRGFDNVFMLHNTNRLLAASLLPSASEIATWAQSQGMKVVVEPDIKAPNYLAVLELI